MPHAELKYSSDLQIDANAILQSIETTILAHDPGSGDCKGRAYPADIYHKTHISVSLSLLTKPHRDESFTRRLMDDIEHVIKRQIYQRCFFSLSLNYSDSYYVTNDHDPEPGMMV